MSDFAFNLPPRRTRAQHTEDVRREFLKHKLKMIANQCEQAEEYCRDMIRAGSDVSDELNELEDTGRALTLVALLLKKQVTDRQTTE